MNRSVYCATTFLFQNLPREETWRARLWPICSAACHDSTRREKVVVEGVAARDIAVDPNRRTWVGVMLRVLDACLGWSFR